MTVWLTLSCCLDLISSKTHVSHRHNDQTSTLQLSLFLLPGIWDTISDLPAMVTLPPSPFSRKLLFSAFWHPQHTVKAQWIRTGQLLKLPHVPQLQVGTPLPELCIQYCTAARTDDTIGTGSRVAKCSRLMMTMISQQFWLKPVCWSHSWDTLMASGSSCSASCWIRFKPGCYSGQVR